MIDYRDKYFETLDKLNTARTECDTLLEALKETQRQLKMTRAVVDMYRREKEEDDDGE